MLVRDCCDALCAEELKSRTSSDVTCLKYINKQRNNLTTERNAVSFMTSGSSSMVSA